MTAEQPNHSGWGGGGGTPVGGGGGGLHKGHVVPPVCSAMFMLLLEWVTRQDSRCAWHWSRHRQLPPSKAMCRARSSTEYPEPHAERCPPCVPGLRAAARAKRKLPTAQPHNTNTASTSGCTVHRRSKRRYFWHHHPTPCALRERAISAQGVGGGGWVGGLTDSKMNL